MDNKLSIAEILTTLRTRKGVTQDEAAANLGVSNKTVSKWETGASLPETEYLTGIADYYGVSIGTLFGREEVKDIEDFICQQTEGLSALTDQKALYKIFQIARVLIREAYGSDEFHKARRESGGSEDEKEKYAAPINYKRLFNPSQDAEYFNRTLWASNQTFLLLLNNKFSNMAVMLAGNEDNFNWLTENAERYQPLLRFLSDYNAIKAIRLFHSQTFAPKFTVDYFAKAMDIDEVEASKFLNEATQMGICGVNKINLKEGLTDIYHPNGNGFILSALTLINEWVCGRGSYLGHWNMGTKMIHGGEV